MARIDDISIQHLMQALWSDRRGGRVSVMVGAGFSRNADKITPDAKPLALWGDLRNLMLRELYPNKIPKSPPDALRLASMYEEAFHRSGLDAMLARELQDLSYQPGELHSLLLSLPWADVFTTNYDTLLERARQKVPDYRYELVLSPQDISTSHRPRIVKLHGSFPSQRPFIFTAEDYRLYSKYNAAFVNLVQQAIIETTLCLIGFSGEDPNFLQWVGWVRDNLGASRPPIYLCGVLDLTPALERMYASMQVIPVDIGPLFPESEINDAGLRHQYATEWLLLKLHQGKPTDWINWPAPYSRPIPEPSYPQPLQVPPALASRIIEDELPEAPDDQLFLRELHPWHIWNKKQQDASQQQQPRDTQAARETADLLLVPELRKLIKRWSAERRVYPGWMLCPHTNWSRNYYGGGCLCLSD